MPGVMMITLMDVTLVMILTVSTISGSGGSRPASFPGAAIGPEGELLWSEDVGGERSMEDEYDALNVRAFTQSRSDTGVNENVNKLLKFGTYSVKMTLNFVLLRMITNICMVHWQMWRAKRTTNLFRVQTVFKCFINQLNPELELLILPGTSADQSSWLNEKFTIVLLVQ